MFTSANGNSGAMRDFHVLGGKCAEQQGQGAPHPLPQSVSFVYTIFPNDFREAVFVCLTSIGTALSQSDPLPLKIILLGVRLQDSLATQDSPGGRHFPPHSTPSESP